MAVHMKKTGFADIAEGGMLTEQSDTSAGIVVA